MDETMSLALTADLRLSAVTMDKSCPNMAYRQTDARSTDDLQHNQSKRNPFKWPECVSVGVVEAAMHR